MNVALDRITEDYIKGEGNLISILQQIQEEYDYIPEDVVSYLSERLNYEV